MDEQLTFEFAERTTIKGFPELRWTGKRPYRSTQYYPAQLRERYGEERDGWINKIFWGDNLQVMSHLLKEYRGKIDLVYIDPPFDSKADYKRKIALKGIGNTTSDATSFEEKQYGDIWTNDEYLQFMYERLMILRELMSDKVRVLPPPRSIKMKRIWHEYSLIEKEYSEPIDFKVSEIDDAKYESKMYEKGSIRLELSTKETVIDDIKNQMRYSRFSLVGEISRYMNLSCVLISRILSEAIDGFDNLVEAVNKHNEVLDDVIIPKIFNTLYEVKSEQKNEDVDVILLKEPKDSGYYEFSADENLVIEKDYNSFTPEEIKKSFHADTYCFDSKPEKECFLQYISSKKVKEIYFTGMFTANQGDLFVQYYDPESKRIRQYYPDFLAKMNDGSYQLIEVKGDNMIDDEVVKAKAEAAEEMSVASGMKYVMYASSVLMKQNVLEHPPVTYSEEPSPLLMVAEDPVPYGK